MYVSLIEDKHEREAELVEDGARVEHIGHECCRRSRTRRVDDVGDKGGEARGDGVGNDGARGGPGEDFDLPGRVENHVALSSDQ